MRILALNSGSSSIKGALIDSVDESLLLEKQIKGIGSGASLVDDNGERGLGEMTFARAITLILGEIGESVPSATSIDAVVHRVVHGGERFTEPTVVDDAALGIIGSLDMLAPLHNPPAIAMLKAARKYFRHVPHVAVFDTAFHHTLPPRAREYALPRAVAKDFGLRRYGFHGINYAHITAATGRYLRKPPQDLRIVACHLGNGASVAAIEGGRSVDTSMGFTPLEGLMMGSRCGDIDPGILLTLLRTPSIDADRLDRILNFESGLYGMTGTTDFATIERRAADGDEQCRLAIALYTYRIKKYIGAYTAAMGGVDAIVFSGGVGEHSVAVRRRVVQGLEFLGAVLNEDRNRAASVTQTERVIDIADDDSRVRLLVVGADEQTQMVRAAATLLEHAAQRSVPNK